jgi:hypothetical protein
MAGAKKEDDTDQEFIRRFALHILPKRFVKIALWFLSSIRNGKKLSFTRETQSKSEKSRKKPLPKCPC